MPINKMQGDQLVNEAALAVIRKAARTEQKDINAAFDQNFGSPLRIYASNPSDALLNISPQQIQRADGVGQSVPPVWKLIVESGTVGIVELTGGTL
jgi:hypothetical protein